jgi:hypothetical protein
VNELPGERVLAFLVIVESSGGGTVVATRQSEGEIQRRSAFDVFFAERECIDDIAVRVEELTGAAGDVTLASMDVPRSRAKPRPDAEDPGQPF